MDLSRNIDKNATVQCMKIPSNIYRLMTFYMKSFQNLSKL